MCQRFLMSCVLPVMIAGGSARAQDCDPPGHLDIAPIVQDGKIHTGLADYESDPGNPFVIAGTKVWGARFHQDPLDPFFTDDPGFTALTGSGLPAGSLFGWNALADLTYWDGTGPVQFGAVPNNEVLRIRLGAQNRYIGTGTGFISGFNVAVVGSGGEVHVHMSFFLHGADGNAIPASEDGVEAKKGIYLLTLELKDSDPSIANSDPVYVVFDNAAPSCADCTALNYIAAELAHDRTKADLDFDRDVDQDDFGRLQACMTGAGIAWTDLCCQSADLDGDGDVDQSDFGLLQRCFSGPGLPADPDCAR